MASTVNNSASPLVLYRGTPTPLGTVGSTTEVIQFSLSTLIGGVPNGLDCLTLSAVGGTGTTGIVLEASIDGGTSFFGITARNSLLTTTVIASDPAVVAAESYDVSGLQGAMFRAGVTGISAGNATLTALYA